MKLPAKWLLSFLVSLVLTTTVAGVAKAQSSYPQALLNHKGTFSLGAAAAMGEPFRGVATSGGIVPDLFPVTDTGLSTADIADAAGAFLATLNTAQLSRVQFPVDDPEWRNWSNVDVGIFARHGISLEEMTQSQKDAAWQLLRVSLSAQGLRNTQDIMKTEQTLLELNDEAIRYGEDKYYFTVMGIPSPTEPWGWQLDGHHLVINYYVQGGQVVMTPTFLGGEPVVTTSGKYQGNTILQPEQDQGLAFMMSLDSSQQQRATLNPAKTRNDQIAAANADNLTLDYQGLPGSDMTGAQRLQLLELIRLHVGNVRDDQARIIVDQIGEHLDETHFAWIGAATTDAVFYYRIHSPVILIEFDHQNPVGTTMLNTPGTPTRDHIHIAVRTPNGNDYGRDLLRQHLATHPH